LRLFAVVAASVAAMAEPAEVPDEKPLGLRQWSTDFRVTVHPTGDPPCEPMRVSAVWRALLNRRGTGYEKYPGNMVDAAGSVTIPAAAYAGETIEFIAWAVCREGNILRPVSNRIGDVVHVPLESCDQGPWEVLSVRGRAELQDDASIWRARFLPLVPGDALPGTDYMRTGPNGRLVFGSPACNGFASRSSVVPRAP
jgi:hypothetical protein